MWHYDECPADAFSLRLENVIVLEPVAQVSSGKRLRSQAWISEAVRLELQVSSRLPHRQLGITESDWIGFLEAPTCLLLPIPLLELVARRAWKTLMLRASWVCGRNSKHCGNVVKALQFPPEGWLQQMRARARSNVSVAVARPRFDFAAQHATALADDLRSCAPAILEGVGEELQDATTLRLEQAVLRLDDHGAEYFHSAGASRVWETYLC